MAELTKIFTGMEKGPEAIDTNFTTLNAKSVDPGNYYTKADIENNMIHRLVTKGVNGAASPAYLTVDKLARLCTLQIDSKLPINTGTMYWIPKEYATGIGNVFIRTGNATLAVYGNGNVELLSNDNDGTQSIGAVTWGY